MELNLSGAYAPYFTRNIVILTDSNGIEGVGEISKALDDARGLRALIRRLTNLENQPYAGNKFLRIYYARVKECLNAFERQNTSQT